MRVTLALCEELIFVRIPLGQRAPHLHHSVFKALQIDAPVSVEFNRLRKMLLHPRPHGSAKAEGDEELFNLVPPEGPPSFQRQPRSDLAQDLVPIVLVMPHDLRDV